MDNPLTIFGAALIFASGIPYIIDVIKKKTRPNIVSWFTWAILINIGAFAALDAGQVNTAILTFADASQCVLIVILGFMYGYAKLSWFDVACQLGAIVGLVLWFVFNSPSIAIFATIAIDAIAALPTFRHSWLKPGEETWQTYFISGIGAVVGLFSLTAFTFDSLAYPTYLVCIGFALSATIVFRRRQVR